MKGLALREPVVVFDTFRSGKATIVTTNGSVTPYGKTRCNVTIEGVDFEPLHVSVAGFRIVDVEWVGSNVLYFDINIGHVASVESLLDVRERKWIYQRSISFNKYSELEVSSE